MLTNERLLVIVVARMQRFETSPAPITSTKKRHRDKHEWRYQQRKLIVLSKERFAARFLRERHIFRECLAVRIAKTLESRCRWIATD